jgi:hypothetical protein
MRPASHLARKPGTLWRLFLIPVLLAAAWSALGGAGHFFYANQYDWFIRDSLLRDLAQGPWPIGYQGHGELVVLRTALGYFLPAAFLAKATSPRWADFFLFLWTVLGVALLFALVTGEIRSLAKKVLFGAILILFSGMDFLGWILVRGGIPPLTLHIEWWSGFVQYSSNTTLLFWVPNHTLPAWLGMGLLWRYRKAPALARFLPYLVLAIPFWGPFAIIGIFPFLLAALAPWVWRRQLGLSHWQHALWPAAAVLLVYPYLTAKASSIGGTLANPLPWSNPLFLLLFLIFLLLEWLILWVFLQRHFRDPWLWICAVILTILPLFRFGPGNDLVMRGSIPALFLLALYLGQALVLERGLAWPARVALLVLFLIGCLTPMEEIARSLIKPRWAPTLTRTVEDTCLGQVPPHYAAPFAPSGLGRILRPPKIVPPGPKDHFIPPASTMIL